MCGPQVRNNPASNNERSETKKPTGTLFSMFYDLAEFALNVLDYGLTGQTITKR
jgi:hypothetical protein